MEILETRFMHRGIDVGAKRPFIVTTCYVRAATGLLGIGRSICSFRDQYSRKRGNLISQGRALKALKTGSNSSPVGKELKTGLSLSFDYKSELSIDLFVETV